jgi:hypothetical protein
MTLLLTTGFDLSIDNLVHFISTCNEDSLTNSDIDESLKFLLNLKNDTDLQLLKMVVQKTNLRLTSEQLMNHKAGNPVHMAYVEWENSWRPQSISSSYNWRISSENFTDLLADDIQKYLKELSLISCVSLKQDELQRASDYINSIGRVELQTVVVDSVIKLKNDRV